MNQAENYSLPKVYRPATPWKSMAPVTLVLLFTLALLTFLTSPDERWIMLLLAGVFIVTLGVVALLLFRQRLEVSTAGLTYVAPGYRVHSTWQNLAGYARRPLGMQSVDVLVLREPGLAMNPVLATAERLKPLFWLAAILQGRYLALNAAERYANIIPIGLFAEAWQTSELGTLIEQLAPQAYKNPLT